MTRTQAILRWAFLFRSAIKAEEEKKPGIKAEEEKKPGILALPQAPGGFGESAGQSTGNNDAAMAEVLRGHGPPPPSKPDEEFSKVLEPETIKSEPEK